MYCKAEEMGRHVNRERQPPKVGVKGRWTGEENYLYLKFLLDNCEVFHTPGRRKRNHIFLTMASMIGTRTPDQCRSHHQKVQVYAKTKQVDGMVKYMIKEKMITSEEDANQLQRHLNFYREKESKEEKTSPFDANYRLYAENNLFSIVLPGVDCMEVW